MTPAVYLYASLSQKATKGANGQTLNGGSRPNNNQVLFESSRT